MTSMTHSQVTRPSKWLAIGQWIVGSVTNQRTLAGYLEPLIQMVKPKWRSDRIRSHILTVRQETSDMYSLVIRPGSAFKPFQAGQYLELTVEKDGVWVSRFFSISSSPKYFQQTGLIEISIRIQDGGRITPWLPTALRAGSIVNLSQAQGEFVLPSHASEHLVMIAGGSGITPFRSMLQQLSLNQDRYNGQVTLLYYARSETHFLFQQELTNYARENQWLSVEFIDSEKEGFVSEDHLNHYLPQLANSPENVNAMICGPSPMILSARDLLRESHLAPSQIHYEFFGPEPTEHQTLGAANVLFKQAGKQIEVGETDQQTLLDLAESHSLKPVSGCRMGVCHQCICQKQSGVVLNTKTGEYSDTGHEEIQLCISRPVGDVVLEL